MSFRLISWGNVPLLPINPDDLIAAASDLATSVPGIREASDVVSTTWGGLREVYETSHTDDAIQLMKDAPFGLGTVADAAEGISGAVSTLAAGVSELHAARESLMQDIGGFRDSVARHGEDWAEDAVLAGRNAELWFRSQDFGARAEGVMADGVGALKAIANVPELILKSDLWDLPLDWAKAFKDWFEPDDWILSLAGGNLLGLLKMLEDLTLTEEQKAALLQIKAETPHLPESHDAQSTALEDAWIVWGLAHGGEIYVDPDGGPCGDSMVCVIGGDIPTGPEGNAITLGRAAVFDRSGEPGDDNFAPTQWHQYHEYAHVSDQVDVGVKRFLVDYQDELQLTWATDGDSHDDNLLERTADLRAQEAIRLRDEGNDPMSAFDRSVYEAGYDDLDGNVIEWGVVERLRRLFGKDPFDDHARREAIADGLGIDPSVDPDYFEHGG